MSWVNDPHTDLTALPQLENSEEQLEERPDPTDKFWEAGHTAFGGRQADYHQGLHVQMCRFDENGDHTQMAENCPHFSAEDEEGPKVMKGWTVQQK